MENLLYVVIGLAIGILAGWQLFRRTADARNALLLRDIDHRDADLRRITADLQQMNVSKKELEEELKTTLRQLSQLEANLGFRKQELETQKQQLNEIGEKFEKQFRLLAQQVLDEKSNSFNQQQEKSLQLVLDPLKENIRQFKSEMEQKYSRETEERVGLREQIKHMLQLNNTLSEQANNLTNALRGQVKQQGNWGEMILESILEYADLKKDLHYFVQERTQGEEGNALQPDIVVRYPGDRSIVIDSKVSLVHYEQYANAATTAEQAGALELLLGSIYRHIDGLSGKKYQDAIGALDFVMLFVPVEGAYITVMQADRELWQYAYKKRVLLISPTNLIAAMKLVYDLWKRDGNNKNAQEIAEKAVRIYDKLAAFIEDFEKSGVQLEKALQSHAEAKKKLHVGKGNLVSLATQMKQKIQHTKPARDLPAGMVEEGLAADELSDETEP